MKNRMRIIRLFFSFIVMSTLLVSCINRKNQFFTEGSFTGIYDDISYYLEINRITDEEYIESVKWVTTLQGSSHNRNF